MADLHGVLLSAVDLCAGSYGYATEFPQFAQADASPIGKYQYVFLSREELFADKKEIKLRPTGPNGSGPYFNSVLSGNYGVRSASMARVRDSSNQFQPVIGLISWSHEWTTYSTWYGTTRHIARLYSNGKTVISYIIECNEVSAYYRTRYAGFKAWSIANINTFPDRNSVNMPSWSYENRGVTWDSMSFFKAKFDYFLWDIISNATRPEFIDPDLSLRYRNMWQGEGFPLSLTNDNISFLYNELTAFEWWDLTGELEGKYRSTAGQAFYNAATTLPKAACNTIANVLESASLVNDILHGDIAKLIPSNPKDAWLFYRYQYSTTKLDIEEYRTLTDRLMKLASLPTIRADGTATNGGITAHCEIVVDPTYLIPQKTRDWLETYGFKLSWYNVWDMIPYSFVVDWFFSIGSFLEVMENENWAYSLPIIESWTSFSTFGPGAQRNYFRIPGHFRAKCPFLDYTQRDASGKTIVKRILDSIALFT